MPDVHKIILSPALIDRSLGDQLIALCCHDTDTITLFNVCTGHVYVQCWDPGWRIEIELSWHPINTMIQSKSTT